MANVGLSCRHGPEIPPYTRLRQPPQSARQRADARHDVDLAQRAAETRAAGEAMIREADDLLCQSWNERMWADGEPVDPSPTVDQALNGGYPWLEIACSRCRTPRTVDLASLPHVPTICVHDLAGRLRCEKCRKAGKRPPAELRQLAKRPRQDPDTMP